MLEGTTTLARIGLDRITFHPGVLGGKACIRGMRMTAGQIIDLVADGLTTAQIIDDFPDLEPEDIRQALEFGALLARQENLLRELQSA